MTTWDEIMGMASKNGLTNKFQASPPKGVTYATGKHGGIDIVLKNDNVPSFSGGTVVRARTGSTGFGNYVVVKDEKGFFNYYAHLDSIAVQEGQQVKDGDMIGVQGSTGNSTGKHLHLEVRSDMENAASTIDPSFYFSKNPKLSYTGIEESKSRVDTEKIKEDIQEKGFLAWFTNATGKLSYGLLVRSGFIILGGFCVYIAVTRGMFGSGGE